MSPFKSTGASFLEDFNYTSRSQIISQNILYPIRSFLVYESLHHISNSKCRCHIKAKQQVPATQSQEGNHAVGDQIEKRNNFLKT